ncbi:hypothetical protein FHG87_008789 [Trinorchestia longiramus]|nr:hypothetical protein FHG87_008789 [Trinorchestia longiramus]
MVLEKSRCNPDVSFGRKLLMRDIVRTVSNSSSKSSGSSKSSANSSSSNDGSCFSISRSGSSSRSELNQLLNCASPVGAEMKLTLSERSFRTGNSTEKKQKSDHSNSEPLGGVSADKNVCGRKAHGFGTCDKHKTDINDARDLSEFGVENDSVKTTNIVSEGASKFYIRIAKKKKKRQCVGVHEGLLRCHSGRSCSSTSEVLEKCPLVSVGDSASSDAAKRRGSRRLGREELLEDHSQLNIKSQHRASPSRLPCSTASADKVASNGGGTRTTPIRSGPGRGPSSKKYSSLPSPCDTCPCHRATRPHSFDDFRHEAPLCVAPQLADISSSNDVDYIWMFQSHRVPPIRSLVANLLQYHSLMLRLCHVRCDLARNLQASASWTPLPAQLLEFRMNVLLN